MYIICHIMYLAAQHMLLSARADFPSSILKITVDVVGLLMVLYPLLPETPYWLVLNGDLAGADAVLQRMAKINGVHLPQVTPCDMCRWQALQNRPRAVCIDMATWQRFGSRTSLDHFCMCWWTFHVVHAARNTCMTTVA